VTLRVTWKPPVLRGLPNAWGGSKSPRRKGTTDDEENQGDQYLEPCNE
jgi:hypothetical protein